MFKENDDKEERVKKLFLFIAIPMAIQVSQSLVKEGSYLSLASWGKPWDKRLKDYRGREIDSVWIIRNIL